MEADKLFLPVPPKKKTPLTSLHIAKQLELNWHNPRWQYNAKNVLYILCDKEFWKAIYLSALSAAK